MWTYSMFHILCFSLSFWLSYPTDQHAHTSDATITTAMCTVNFKELKRRFWKRVTHTCLQGNVCTPHSDSSLTFSYVIRNSNQVRVSPPENTLYPISCCCHVVGCLSLKFLFTEGNWATLCQNCTRLEKMLCELCMDGVTVTCDIISESWSPQTDEEWKYDWMWDSERRLLMEIVKCVVY